MCIHENNFNDFFKGRKIVVTGGTGSIGSSVVERALRLGAGRIVVLSRDDTRQHLLKQKYLDYDQIRFRLGDVRDYDAVKETLRGIELAFHTAALKQIAVCENNALEAVRTNVLGSANIIRAGIENGVERVINVSTDKAINAAGAMGATKFLAEKLFQNAARRTDHVTRFCSVRFGNVLGSRGSVVPFWLEQVKCNKPMPLTDPAMTRFIMTMNQAVDLILKASYYCRGGETFIFKMRSARLGDLAEALRICLRERGGVEPRQVLTGPRPGEKHYEQLVYGDEASRVLEDAEMYVVLPDYLQRSGYYHFKPVTLAAYRSDEAAMVSVSELSSLVRPLLNDTGGGDFDEIRD